MQVLLLVDDGPLRPMVLGQELVYEDLETSKHADDGVGLVSVNCQPIGLLSAKGRLPLQSAVDALSLGLITLLDAILVLIVVERALSCDALLVNCLLKQL